ncbi:MAG: TonB-dependent receptor, partial [Novosphingobium sp.]
LSYTDPQTIAAIRVVPGVAPVSMGGDNIGGVISVRSAAPRFATGPEGLVTGEASAFYRSNGDGFGGSLSLTLASEHLSATYTGSFTQSDQYKGGGRRTGAAGGIVRSSEYKKTDHALALAAHTGAGMFRLKGGYHFSPYEGFPNQSMDMVSNKSWFVNAGYEGVFDWGTLEASADYRDTDHAMDFLEDKQPGAMPMLTEVHSFDAALKAELPVSARDTLRVGTEYHHQWLDDSWPPVPGHMMMGPNTYININGATRDRFGAYGEWQAHWNDRLSTLVGVRMDRVTMNTGLVQPYSPTSMMSMDDAMAARAFNASDRKQTDTNWSASALVSYALGEGVAVELGYAHKARSPNIYERFSWGRGAMSSRMIGWYGDGNGYIGNLNLKPERADTVSAALEVKGAADRWSLRVSPYYTHVDDYIDAAFVRNLTNMMGMPTGFVQLRFANQQAEFYGVDVSGQVALWDGGNGGDGTTLNGSLAWVRGRNLSDGGALYHQMPLDVKLGLSHRKGAFEAGLDLEWVAEKNRVDHTRNEPRTDDYALVNLRAAYALAGVRVSAEVTNLFDKGYALPLGGMSLGDFKATGVRRPVPGRGRSFNLGLSTRF